MKRDVIIGQKLFETCKLSEFYLNLIVNSKYEDESPFQLAKAYTQKLYEIVERYDRLLEANSQRENLNLQLGDSRAPSGAAAAKKSSSSVCSTPASTLPSGSSQARTSTPNKCFTSPSSSLATQLQLQLQMQLHSQSTPATPCQSTSTSSLNLYNLAHAANSGASNSSHAAAASPGMRQSSSNYQIGSSRRHFATGPAYKLNSISTSNINSNFYKQNQQRLYSIYYDDYLTSDDDNDDDEAQHGGGHDEESIVDDDDAAVAGYDDELTVRNEFGGHNYKTITISKSGKAAAARAHHRAAKNRRDSLVDGDVDMDSTILSSNNNNVSVRLDDISYDYGEYQHDTQIDLDETSSQRELGSAVSAGAGAHDSQVIEKSYSNLSKDSGVLIDSYHSDYSSHHLLNLTNNSSLNAVSSSRAKSDLLAQTPVSSKSLRSKGAEKAAKKAAKAAAAAATNGGTTSSSASISDNDETHADQQESQLLAHTRLNQYIQSADDSGNEPINYADDDVYDYEAREDEQDGDNDDDDDEDEDDDDDEFDDDEEPRQYSITDSTHILLKKKASKRSQAASSLIAKLKSPQKETSTAASSLAKLTPAAVANGTPTPYTHYVKNPNKYSPIRASKLAFMPNKSSLIARQSAASPGQDADFLGGASKKQLSLIAEKHSEMDDHFESDAAIDVDESGHQRHMSSLDASSSPRFGQQLNLDLDMSMISMMVESDEQRRLRTGSVQSPSGAKASLEHKVKSFSDKIESMTNRLKNDSSHDPNASLSTSYSSSSTLSTPSPTSSSASSSSAASDAANTTTTPVSTAPAASSEATSMPPPSPFATTPSMSSNKSSPFLFNSISSMNVSMLDNIQATNTSLDFDNMNTSILMFN